jgi:signal transduction histidine kinase
VSTVIDWKALCSKERRFPELAQRRFPGRLVALGFILWGVQTGSTRFGRHGTGLALALLTAACSVAWVVWSTGHDRILEISGWAVTGSLVVFGTCGAVLTGLDPHSAALVFPATAVVYTAARFRSLRALAAVAAMSAIVLSTEWLTGRDPSSGLTYTAFLFGIYGLGLGRRSQILRAETAEQLLVETQRANTEEGHAAALAERSRIAREIHDVLAHSLAALTVQLEAADALLTSGTDPVKAHNYVVNARRMAREGLSETRRAIAALREDTPPLRMLLRALAESYQTDTGAPATVIADCEPTDLPPDAALALYRTAQESLTNTRKHAPNAPIELALVCTDSTVELTITNQAPTAPVSALAASGGGYGLTGLKERAELAGGTLESGPYGDGWRVRLSIPHRDAPTLDA